MLHLGDAVPGDPGDNYSFLWNLWWLRHVLATPDLPYFHTTYLFYPFGTTIADHPHCALPALLAATVLKPLSIITAYNVLLLAFLFANMAAMYALAWTIVQTPNEGARRRAAILAAVVFGLSPYVAAHLLGHFDLVAVWVLPAFALALRRAVQGSNRAAVAAGVVLGATAYIAYYYVVYLCLFTVVYLLASAFRVSVARGTAPAARGAWLRHLWLAAAALFTAVGIAIATTGGGAFAIGGIEVSSRTPQNALTAAWLCALVWLTLTWRPRFTWAAASTAATRRALLVLLIVVGTFVAGAAPLFKEAASLIARGEYVSPRYGWRSAPRGVDVVAPLLGHPLHPLFRTASARAYDAVSADRVEAIAWVGVVPVLLLFFTRRDRRAAMEDVRLWRIVAIVFLVWALGPFLVVAGFDTGLKLPAILARFVPFVANARMPGRAMVVVFMALAVLLAAGLAGGSRQAGRLQRPAVQWLVIALVAFEYWAAPIHLTPLDRPAVYQALAAEPPGAVCEVPLGIGDGLSVGVGSQDRRILFYATQHEHPLVGGYIGRMPPRAKERIEAMDVAGPLLELSSSPAAGIAHPAAIAGRPDETCRYLVVNRPASPAAVLTYVQQLPAERIAADESRDLYRLR